MYKLCLYMLEEHNCLIVTSYPVPKLRYNPQAQKRYKPLLHCTESLICNDIPNFYIETSLNSS